MPIVWRDLVSSGLNRPGFLEALVVWAVARRYMSAESLAKTHVRVINGDGETESEEVKELAAAG